MAQFSYRPQHAVGGFAAGLNTLVEPDSVKGGTRHGKARMGREG